MFRQEAHDPIYCSWVVSGKNWREKQFLAWYKFKLICLLYFHFVPSPKKFLSPIFFPRQTKWNRQYAGGKEGFSKFSLMLKTRYCRFHLLWPSENLGTKKFLVLVQIQNHLCAVLSICTKPGKIFSRPDFSRGPKLVESTMLVCFCLFLGKTWFKRLQKDFWKSPITALGLKSGLQ